MFSDFVYSTFVLGGLYTTLDILSKINTNRIKSVSDFKRDLFMKGLYTVKIYTNVTVFLKDVIYKVNDCLDAVSKGPVGYCDIYYSDSDSDYDSDSDSDSDEDGVVSYKLDLFLPESKKLLKAKYFVKYKNWDIKVNEGGNESESDGEIKTEIVKYDEIENIDVLFDKDDEDDLSNSLRFIYDYKTSTYLEMKDIDISDNEVEMNTVKSIIDRIDNSIYMDRLFWNIELNNAGTKHDITNYLSKYYRSGNVILSREFIQYIICDNSLDIKLNEDYVIHIMDKDIQMITLESDKSVSLYINKEKSELDVLSYKIN